MVELVDIIRAPVACPRERRLECPACSAIAHSTGPQQRSATKEQTNDLFTSLTAHLNCSLRTSCVVSGGFAQCSGVERKSQNQGYTRTKSIL